MQENQCHTFGYHCVKNVRIRSFPGPYFPAFRLNIEIYPVNISIQSKWSNIQTRKTPNTGSFFAVYVSSALILAAFTYSKSAIGGTYFPRI